MVATCYLLGVSTRRMDKLVRSLGITGLSKSQVSEMAKDLDEQVSQFRSRPLDAGPYTFVAADALTMKVREGGRVVKIAVMVATASTPTGTARSAPASGRCPRRYLGHELLTHCRAALSSVLDTTQEVNQTLALGALSA